MSSDKDPGLSEREQTDESLRAEREKVDEALNEKLIEIDETADGVINRARARADAVLAAARVRMDQQSDSVTLSARVKSERSVADAVLKVERANADESLREERLETGSVLASEREETDRDLFSERAQSDAALAARDERLRLVSHDLRTMLNHVIGFAQLVETAVLDNHVDQVLMYARRIQRSGARMDRLVGDLVDVASIDAGRLVVTRDVGDPCEVVTEIVDAFQTQATARELSLEVEIVPPVALASFDPARILQVLTNLLSNAIKFTPAHGRVVVRVERSGSEIHFAVSDTGPGIPDDMLEAVFEKFLQVVKNDRRGLGLGLYISKCIVHGHGGRIWAESNLGRGVTFHFTLPVHSPTAAH